MMSEDKSVWFYLMNNAMYMIALIPIIYMLQFLPSIEVLEGSWLYEFVYSWPYFYTSWFSISKLATWMVLLVVGFTFVNVSNLNGEWKSIFMSWDGSFKDIKGLIKLGLVMHFISPLIFLRGRYDLDQYCKDKPMIQAVEEIKIDDIIGALESFLTNYVFVKQPLPDCREYNPHSRWVFNYIYAVVFIIGCNFTHCDKYPFN